MGERTRSWYVFLHGCSHQRTSLPRISFSFVQDWEPWLTTRAAIEDLQSEMWDLDVADRVREFELQRTDLLCPELGYTEDISRFITPEALEECLEKLSIHETIEMKLIMEKASDEQTSSGCKEIPTLSLTPYEEKFTNLSPSPNSTMSEFDVRPARKGQAGEPNLYVVEELCAVVNLDYMTCSQQVTNSVGQDDGHWED